MRVLRSLLTVSIVASTLTIGGVAVASSASASTTRTVCATGCDFTTIQDAVNAAMVGDTITVGAGTYTESITGVGAVSLLGTDATIVGSISFTPNLAGTSRIEGFTFNRSVDVANSIPTYKMVSARGATHTVQVHRNTFSVGGFGGALGGTAKWEVTENIFENQNYTETLANYESRTLYFENSAPSIIHNNIFRSVGHGIFLTGIEPSGSRVTSNSFEGSGQAVLVGRPTGVEIIGNDFTGGNGVYLDLSTNAIIRNNKMTASGAMIWQTNNATTGTQVFDNDLSSPGYAPAFGAPFGGKSIFNRVPSGLNAARNWWGTRAAPTTIATAGSFANPVTVTPRITSFTPGAAPQGFNSERGFWPRNVVEAPVVVGVPVAGDRSITVPWTLDSVSGVLAVQALAYNRDTGGSIVRSCLVESPSGTSGACTITALTNGTEYWVTARVRSADGWSDQSPRVGATPGSQVGPSRPDTPGLGAVTSGNRQIAVPWTLGPDGGSPVTVVQALAYNRAAGGSIVRSCQVRSPIAATTCTITGLRNGTTYYVTVRARNAVGWSNTPVRVAMTPNIPTPL